MSFDQLRKTVNAWEHFDGVEVVEYPSASTARSGNLYVLSISRSEIVLVHFSGVHKHVFVTLEKDTWKYGTVTLCLMETGLLRTFKWDPSLQQLKPSIKQRTELDDSARAVEQFLESCYSS